MILFGKFFKNHSPKEINIVFGYRTRRSMMNQETWQFAHHMCGRIWTLLGWLLLPMSMLAMAFVYKDTTKVIGIFGGIVCLLQTIILIGSLFPIEIALKNNFDDEGHPRH